MAKPQARSLLTVQQLERATLVIARKLHRETDVSAREIVNAIKARELVAYAIGRRYRIDARSAARYVYRKTKCSPRDAAQVIRRRTIVLRDVDVVWAPWINMPVERALVPPATLAAYLAVTPQHVRDLIRAGAFGKIKRRGTRYMRYHLEMGSVLAWLRSVKT